MKGKPWPAVNMVATSVLFGTRMLFSDNVSASPDTAGTDGAGRRRRRREAVQH